MINIFLKNNFFPIPILTIFPPMLDFVSGFKHLKGCKILSFHVKFFNVFLNIPSWSGVINIKIDIPSKKIYENLWIYVPLNEGYLGQEKSKNKNWPVWLQKSESFTPSTQKYDHRVEQKCFWKSWTKYLILDLNLEILVQFKGSVREKWNGVEAYGKKIAFDRY